MNQKKEKKEPLLYIQQPNFITFNPKMQNTYSIRKAEVEKMNLQKEKEMEKHLEPKEMEIPKELEPKEKEIPKQHELKDKQTKPEKKKSRNGSLGEYWLNNEPTSREVQDVIQQYEKEKEVTENEPFETKKKRINSFKPVKKFKEMNLDERLEYLINFPRQLPPVPCIFQTEENSFKGVLVNRDENNIEIKLLDETIESVETSLIKDIKMFGF